MSMQNGRRKYQMKTYMQKRYNENFHCLWKIFVWFWLGKELVRNDVCVFKACLLLRKF